MIIIIKLKWAENLLLLLLNMINKRIFFSVMNNFDNRWLDWIICVCVCETNDWNVSVIYWYIEINSNEMVFHNVCRDQSKEKKMEIDDDDDFLFQI